ncbi:MAG: efflux RND transporter periplasmic adaptor subunit [Lachnospiraceae bacterium]|nr:efflux RND transporter periplasmic adaptor subunit [Lachnospiraceae bacterium]
MKKKKIVVGFLGFLVAMWLCTVISKSIYTSRLPVVTTTSIEQKYVEHIVEAEGIIIAGNKNPINVLSGLRIDRIEVQEGDRVEEGDVLFWVDVEDLEEIMEAKQQKISNQQLLITKQQNLITEKQLQINAQIYNGQLAEVEKIIEEQRAREDYDALATREDILVGRAANEVSKAENDLENHRGEEGYSEEALEDALQAAAYAEGDAKWQRENTMKEAQRKIDDMQLPDEANPSLEISQIELSELQLTLSDLQAELSVLQEDLAVYKEIKEAEGQITAASGGLITDIYISIGNRTPDTAAMLFADDTIPCQFKVTIDKEQKKYVSLNDIITLKLDGSSKGEDYKVNYLSESATSPGNYEIYVNLPEGVGTPGLSASMRRSEVGEKYYCCLTPTAVHKVDSRSYVYVVKEREGILGMEYYVEQLYVKILDENEYWIAVEGALDDDSKVVENSTMELRNGEVVRY